MSHPIKTLVAKGFTETEAIEFLRSQAIDWFFMAKIKDIENPMSTDFEKLWEEFVELNETLPELDKQKFEQYLTLYRK